MVKLIVLSVAVWLGNNYKLLNHSFHCVSIISLHVLLIFGTVYLTQ